MEVASPLDRLRTWLWNSDESALGPYGHWIIFGLGILALLIGLRLLMSRVMGGGRTRRVSEVDLYENLSEYPPAPGDPGTKRLTIDGQPARLRLVVVAPVGKDMQVNEAAVEGLLDQIYRGLGEIARVDRPRIRVWPPQLSSRGFAPSFHREVEKPEPDGQLSHWVLLAGPAKAGRWSLLLGLAVWCDRPSNLGKMTLEAHRWQDTLRVRNRDD